MSCSSLSRRQFLQVVGAGSAALALGNPICSDQKRRPNIVLILADDLGYGGVGVQGCKDIPTPSIDSIAANGVRFTSGYVSCPVCSPTRAGLLTGRYQQRFGHEFNPGPPDRAQENFGLALSEKTIASHMKADGYVTGIVGKWHLGYKPEFHPQKRGFDEFFGFLSGSHSYTVWNDPRVGFILRGTTPVNETEYLTDALGREAVAFIDRHKNEPFFLYVSFNAVHTPMQAPEKYLGRFAGISDQKRRIHAAMLSAMDDQIGNVLAAIRKNSLEEDTLIFFLSDNGGPTGQNTSSNAPLRGVKGQVYEGGIRVPFMMQWNGRLPRGVVRDEPVIALDIVPTTLAAAGAKADGAKLDGVDILPYAGGKAGAPHEALFWRYGNQSAARCGNLKLVKMKDSKPQLFDLSADIGETADLAASKPEELKELESLLAKWDAQLTKPAWGSGRAGRDAKAEK